MAKNLTVPNALTLLRALGIPVFVYLALIAEADGWAIMTLVVGGATDYFDGKIARAWGQESRLGELMDPTIDRIYVVVTLVVLYMRDAIPLWVITVLLARDALLAILTLALAWKSKSPLAVTYLGKAATFNLLYAFPLLLLALNKSWYGDLSYVLGWSFAIWGIALYISTGIAYLQVGIRALGSSNIEIHTDNVEPITDITSRVRKDSRTENAIE
jgi:cardiolipin synthase